MQWAVQKRSNFSFRIQIKWFYVEHLILKSPVSKNSLGVVALWQWLRGKVQRQRVCRGRQMIRFILHKLFTSHLCNGWFCLDQILFNAQQALVSECGQCERTCSLFIGFLWCFHQCFWYSCMDRAVEEGVTCNGPMLFYLCACTCRLYQCWTLNMILFWLILS